MTLRSFKEDLVTSVVPVLGPLSGGSWMTISPLAALKALTTNSRKSYAQENETDERVEVIRVPLSDSIWMEVKSSSKDDLLISWELSELLTFIESSLRNYEDFDPDIDQKFVLGRMFESSFIQPTPKLTRTRHAH